MISVNVVNLLQKRNIEIMTLRDFLGMVAQLSLFLREVEELLFLIIRFMKKAEKEF